jgi:S-adenosylmethionine uptake transporter
VLYGFVFFAETPTRSTALGAAIIIASGVYVVFREDRTSVPTTRPVLRTQTRYVSGTLPRLSTLFRRRRRGAG